MKTIKNLMFLDLTNQWVTHTAARFTYSLHPTWSPSNRNLHSTSRKSTSIYHTIACGAAHFNADRSRFTHSTSACRYGCTCDETVNHALLDCPHTRTLRIPIIEKCDRLNIEFSIKNMLTEPRLRHLTERYLLQY